MKRRYWDAAWTFLPYLRPYKRLAAVSVGLTLIGSVLALAAPWPFALLVGYVLVHKPPPEPVTGLLGTSPKVLIGAAVVAGFLIVFLIHAVTVLSEWVNTKLNLSVTLDFRSQLFAHCLELSDCFTDEAAPGDFMYRINYESHAVGSMAVAIPPLAQSLITLAGYFVIALKLDPVLALLSTTVVPFIYRSIGYYARRIEPRLVTVRGLEGLSLTMVNTAMSMVHVIASFNRQAHEHLRFRRQGEQARDARVRLTVRQAMFSLTVAMITATGTGALIGVGANHVLTGVTSLAALLVLMSYIGSMYKPLEALAGTVSQLQTNCVSIMFSKQLLQREPQVQERPVATVSQGARGHLLFDHVSFRYAGRESTLRDITFEVQPGETVALVGVTGAGKSTLLSLLPRFIDPSEGAIYLDGHDLRDLTLSSLRDQVALVRQEPLLFSRSIGENIAYARPEATMGEIVAAARAANAHEFISQLPDGYETVLGERGARVSGGERQRLALARAFLKNAPILLLDEPTASVDSKTEAGILEALHRLTVGRTTFIAAHRLSTVRDATRVLVLDQGRLVDNGAPWELLGREGLFRTFTRLQTLGSSNGDHNGHESAEPADEPGSSDSFHLLQRNSLVQLVDRARARRGTYTGAIMLNHREGQGRIFAEDGQFHSAHGELGEGDELVVRALAWHDEDFTFSLDSTMPLPPARNVTMSYSELVTAAAHRQSSDAAPAASTAVLDRPDGPAVAEPPPPPPAEPAQPPRVAPIRYTGRPSIVLLGSMSAMPVGGVIWQTLQYVVGFQRLGYDVFYVEAHGRFPRMLTSAPDDDPMAAAAGLIQSVMSRANMAGRWALHGLDEQSHGMTRDQLLQRYREAAAIINLHGGTVPRPEHETGRLVYLETDPVPIQAYVAEERAGDIEFLSRHDAFFSYGENYGAIDCGVPQSPRFNFVPTRPPVVLEYWPFATATTRPFTTIGNWSQFQDVVIQGETYSWSKRLEFLKFLDLPKQTSQAFELALSQCSAEDQQLLRSRGWGVVDALDFSTDRDSYRSYIAESRAEFTVAKDQNVRLRSGWFSDRSATYLASGRPVVTQDTGFGNVLPTGLGLFRFTTLDEARAAVERINGDYDSQRRVARRIAEEHFDSDVVLGKLLRELGLPAPARRVR